MRSVIVIMFGLLVNANVIFAQVNSADDFSKKERFREKLEAQRIAYITNKLDLSSDESIKFWPVYNEYAKKRLEVRRENRDLRKGKGSDQMDSRNSVDDQLAMQEKELQLKRDYYGKFKQLLPERKLIRLEEVEKEFNMEVIKTLREKRNNRAGGR
ncbi:MAG TPA: hypothetical protein PK209_10250 [Saprospiraceae bacterium]|nr:hypothetical protein [Candidatus Vicinibacter affinis]MBP6172547.1 hypothetical protein [Saprospiraceae bacterium]HQX44926.1 hypothetical protein [Saprospiraceae bacterium]